MLGTHCVHRLMTVPIGKHCWLKRLRMRRGKSVSGCVFVVIWIFPDRLIAFTSHWLHLQLSELLESRPSQVHLIYQYSAGASLKPAFAAEKTFGATPKSFTTKSGHSPGAFSTVSRDLSITGGEKASKKKLSMIFSRMRPWAGNLNQCAAANAHFANCWYSLLNNQPLFLHSFQSSFCNYTSIPFYRMFPPIYRKF